MKLVTSKEYEVYGRMAGLLDRRGYTRVAYTEDTATFRRREGLAPTVNIFKQPGLIHDPIKAQVSDLSDEPGFAQGNAAYNSAGLMILLDQAEENVNRRNRVEEAAEKLDTVSTMSHLSDYAKQKLRERDGGEKVEVVGIVIIATMRDEHFDYSTSIEPTNLDASDYGDLIRAMSVSIGKMRARMFEGEFPAPPEDRPAGTEGAPS